MHQGSHPAQQLGEEPVQDESPQIVPGLPSLPGVSSAGGRMAAHPCQLLELNWVWEERDSMGKKKKRGGRRKKREHDASAPQPVKLDASYYQEKEILND